MLNGIWSYKIGSSMSMATGVAHIQNGRFFGGNDTYYFLGKIREENGRLYGSLHTKHHTGPLNSVLGPLEEYSLELEGCFEDGDMRLVATAPELSKRQLQVYATKVADLED